jgi:excisionase family DNA binding protein
MPYRVFNLDEVAAYLNLNRAEVERLVKYQEIPFVKHGERLVFQQRVIDAWASQRILELPGRGLGEYHQQATQNLRESLPNEAILPELIQPEYIDPSLTAKTKASVLQDMVKLADKTGLVNNAQELLLTLKAREELCSTGVPGGLALLHSRDPQPYLFEASFIVLGRSLQEIPFGSPDGQPTTLFFLICSQNPRLHLHTLSRLCLMAQKTDLAGQLRACADADSMHECLIAIEEQVLQNKKSNKK